MLIDDLKSEVLIQNLIFSKNQKKNLPNTDFLVFLIVVGLGVVNLKIEEYANFEDYCNF